MGPLPGTDPREAARIVYGELPGLPHLAELPQRGPGADAIGRTAALLVDMHVDVHAGRWRLVARRSHEERRAGELLEQDLDALEEAGAGHPGPLKLQLVGPWTLGACLELPRGDKVLTDPGATADLAASLSEAVALHLAEVRRRVPKAARVLVQFDEPLLPAVLTGSIATASGWGRLPVPEPATAEQALVRVLSVAGDDAGARCSTPRAPLSMLRRAGARFLAMDAALLETVPEEDVGEAIEAGTGLLIGLVPAPPHHQDDLADLAIPVRRLWGRLGLGEGHWGNVVVTPSADLSELGHDEALAVLRRCRELARSLASPEGDPDEDQDQLGLH